MEKKKTDFSVVYFILGLGLMFVAQFALLAKQVETISYSQFKALVKKGQVAEVAVRDKTIGVRSRPRG